MSYSHILFQPYSGTTRRRDPLCRRCNHHASEHEFFKGGGKIVCYLCNADPCWDTSTPESEKESYEKAFLDPPLKDG